MVTAGLELPPGTSVDRRYRIQRVLGRGGFGRTYLAADEWRFGELCVLKEFVPSSQGDSIVAQKLHELFQREATVLHKLNHPQIPKFFAVFEEDGRLFIAQEYIDGKTCWTVLQERQRQGRAFVEPEVTQWLRDLLQVLDYLHSKNIVHRDISPDNIMLPRGRRYPVLIDFGVVKQAATHFYGINAADPDGLIQASVSVGKFGYAPYEQIRMGQCSPRSDLYALGVTAIVLLTGKTPNLLIDPQSLEWQWHSQVKLDRQLVKILDRMTAEKPQDRYLLAKDVLKDLHLLYRSTQRSTSRGQADSAAIGQSALDPSSDSLPSEKPELLTPQADPVPALTTQVEAPSFSAVRPIAVQPTTLQPTTQPFPLLALTGVGAHSESGGTGSYTLEAEVSGAGPVTRVDSINPPRSTLLGSRPIVLVGDKAKQPELSWKRILILAFLTMLPMGGALVGVQSPYINSLCQALGNCAGSQFMARYQQAEEQAAAAKTLSENAQNLSDLQHARDRLADSIAQLSASPNVQLYPGAQQILSNYQASLQQVEARLEMETRSTQLLQRAEAEAQKAEEQTKVAKTNEAYEAASMQWRKALATLQAISNNSFVAGQKTRRSQEYTARLDTVNLHVATATKSQDKSAAPGSIAPGSIAQGGTVAFAPPSASASNPSPQSPAPAVSQATPQVSSSPKQQAAAPPADSPSEDEHPVVNQPPVAVSRSSSSLSQASAPRPRTPQNLIARINPLQNTASELRNQIFAGNVALSAIQTLNDVSVWIDGARVNRGGNFVANLVIENHSDRPFGFVPLFAEVRDTNNQPVRSRLMFSGTDAIVGPGRVLKGQVYVLDRQWRRSSPQNLALVIHEGTSGSRRFYVTF